jgi:hypothetical protein
MHRLVTLVSVVIAFASVMVFARGNMVTAQDDMASHPVVGAWTWVNGEGEDAVPSVAHFHPDGTYIEVMPWGAVPMAVWEPTGEDAVTVTQVINYLDDNGELVQGQGRATVEYDATTDTITWRGTFLSRYQDGRTDIAADADDPGSVSIGTRLEPQPMASLDELMDTPLPFGAATPTP